PAQDGPLVEQVDRLGPGALQGRLRRRRAEQVEGALAERDLRRRRGEGPQGFLRLVRPGGPHDEGRRVGRPPGHGGPAHSGCGGRAAAWRGGPSGPRGGPGGETVCRGGGGTNPPGPTHGRPGAPGAPGRRGGGGAARRAPASPPARQTRPRAVSTAPANSRR